MLSHIIAQLWLKMHQSESSGSPDEKKKRYCVCCSVADRKGLKHPKMQQWRRQKQQLPAVTGAQSFT